MAVSLRERAMAALVDLFNSQKRALPVSDPYAFSWDIVRRSHLTDNDRRKVYAMAVLESTERKTQQMGCRICTLPVELEIHLRVPAKEAEPATWVNEVLENIYRLVRSDNTLGGLVNDVNFMAAEVDVEGYTDRQVEVTVLLEVLYKHAELDWRIIVPGASPPA